MTTKKTASKKRIRKHATIKQAPTKNRWDKLWPPLLGAVVVVVSCFFLLRAIFNSPIDTNVAKPEGYTVYGIDVSHHQGVINWELLCNRGAVNGQPLAFVFIKATEGSDIVDAQFKRNFSEAGKYGIMRGAYHFYRTTTSAKMQAEHFIRNVELLPGDLPPVLDVETHPQDISAEDFRQGILEWLARVEQHYGVRPILYTYHSFHQQYMNDPVFNLYPYWIAHYYVDSVRYQGAWTFWQNSDSGEMPGIKEKVDLNVFNGTYEEMQLLAIPSK